MCNANQIYKDNSIECSAVFHTVNKNSELKVSELRVDK